jgi:GPH family glycoside/pentoside/hexuronide:cation symporter
VLAGAVVWIARVVDAFSDPAMGRLSDLTRWKVGRRRGYFLLGAVPFGVCFALMWQAVPFEGQAGRFAYYSGVYVMTSLAMTVLSIPYMALLPEMANSYDERTSFNTYRSAASVLGTFAAVAMKPLAESLGGGSQGWAAAGAVVGVWLVLPWLAVFRVSFERPGAVRSVPLAFRAGLKLIAAHANFRTLAAFFILARIAVDLIGAMFLFYFVDFLGRERDFEKTMFLFLSIVVLCLPIWLRVARRHDKRTIFVVGATWWIVTQFFIFAGQPDWPRWAMFAIASLAAIGYAVADLMPWSMLGDVIDEDELASGDRREGVYVGFFTFLRKLGGASAVLLIGFALDLAGYVGGAGPGGQSDLAVQTIRVLTSLVPALFLALAVVVALRYSLGRVAHQRVLEELRMRDHPR